MESILTLVKSLDPSSQGALAFLAVLGLCAAKLFPEATPARIKLVVFFTLVGFAGGGLLYTSRNARDQAEKADPHEQSGQAHPVADRIGRVLGTISVVGVAHAADVEGWIFVGKYDESGRRWVEGPTVTRREPAGVPQSGELVQTLGATPVYDDRPRFSLFSQSWNLGKKLSEISTARRLEVAEAPVFVGQNVWCKVRPR